MSFCRCGIGRNRTADTRIFSPLLYLLSYNPAIFREHKYKGFYTFMKEQNTKNFSFCSIRFFFTDFYVFYANLNGRPVVPGIFFQHIRHTQGSVFTGPHSG